MTYSALTFGVADRVATITVNRPDKLNALNHDTLSELERAIDEAGSRDDVGGVIITGAGRAFVAGADISELATQSALDAKRRSLRGQAIFRKYERSRKPVVAAINGFALGGGCELAMACHVRIASDQAKFGQPEVKLGLCAGYGGTQRLTRLVGRGRALQLLLTGETIDAAEALRIGLVNRVVPAAELIGTTEEMLRQMLSNAPLALALTIEAVDHGSDVPLDEALNLEANLFGLLAGTKDAGEGTRAFLEKRRAQFVGA
ncbi:MAG: enoyl-CoA hydratase-related protein [Gemmatimonadota bacterium]